MTLQSDIDLLNPPAEWEKKKHKMKRLVPSPNSFFMDVKCQGCFSITTVFSHSQTVVSCPGCSRILCTPSGGKANLTVGGPSQLHVYSCHMCSLVEFSCRHCCAR